MSEKMTKEQIQTSIDLILLNLYDGIEEGARLRGNPAAWGKLCGALADSEFTSRKAEEYKKLVGEQVRANDREAVRLKVEQLAEENGRTAGDTEQVLLKLGDHVELAQTLLGALTKEACEEEPPAYGYGQIHTYQAEGLWRPVPDAEMSSRVQCWSGSPVMTGIDDNGLPKTRPLKLRAGDVNGAMALATSRCAGWGRHSESVQVNGDTGWMESGPKGVAFSDAFVLVEPRGSRLSMTTARHSPEHRARFGFDFPLPSDVHETPRFTKYLRDIWGGTEDFARRCAVLQEFAGAALLGLGPHFGKALLLKGAPGTGKSTFLQILEACMPQGSVTTIPPQKFDDSNYVVDLVTSRLNCVRDLSSDAIRDREGVKGIVHGEPLTARRVFERAMSFKPEAAHAYGCNDYPSVPGADRAFFDRWLILRLEDNRIFRRPVDAEPIEPLEGEDELATEDRRLAEQIIDEELPGVVAWAIEGVRRLIRQDRYTTLPAMTRWLRDWGGEADAVGAWLDARAEETWTARTCNRKGVEWGKMKDLFNDFNQYCEESRFKPCSIRTFSKRVRGAGVAVKRNNGFRLAIRLRAAYMGDDVV